MTSDVFPNRHVEWDVGGGDVIITIHWRRWFGFAKPEIRRYRGRSTVWHDAETGERQEIFIESFLSDVYTKAKWGRNEKF